MFIEKIQNFGLQNHATGTASIENEELQRPRLNDERTPRKSEETVVLRIALAITSEFKLL
jgi:hypothetical protein